MSQSLQTYRFRADPPPVHACPPHARAGMPVAAAFLAAALACLAGGCATTDESDMPWSTPQPWELAPMVPGFTPQ